MCINFFIFNFRTNLEDKVRETRSRTNEERKVVGEENKQMLRLAAGLKEARLNKNSELDVNFETEVSIIIFECVL